MLQGIMSGLYGNHVRTYADMRIYVLAKTYGRIGMMYKICNIFL